MKLEINGTDYTPFVSEEGNKVESILCGVSDGGELYVKSKLIIDFIPMRMDDLTKLVEQIRGVEWQKER